jgi:hypothetical protein
MIWKNFHVNLISVRTEYDKKSIEGKAIQDLEKITRSRLPSNKESGLTPLDQ